VAKKVTNRVLQWCSQMFFSWKTVLQEVNPTNPICKQSCMITHHPFLPYRITDNNNTRLLELLHPHHPAFNNTHLLGLLLHHQAFSHSRNSTLPLQIFWAGRSLVCPSFLPRHYHHQYHLHDRAPILPGPPPAAVVAFAVEAIVVGGINLNHNHHYDR